MARKRATRLPTQGKRSGVAIGVETDLNQVESIDNFFNQARSPEEKKEDDVSTKIQINTARRSSRRATRGPQRKAEETMRLSLPGQASASASLSEDASSTTSNSSRNGEQQATDVQKRTVMGLPSPSELSKVSTLPPTPGTSLHEDLFTQEQVEVTRHAANEEELMEQQAPMDEELEATEFPMQNDDDDDGDDLAPPVMEDDELDQEISPHEPEAPEGDVHDQKQSATSTLPDNDLSDTESDSDPKEGLGFNMVHDPETPEGTLEESLQQKSRGRKKKSSKNRHSIESEDRTPIRKSKNRKKRRVIFSPKGIPTGNRDYDRIPIVEPSPDDDGGLRRSKRAKTLPLEFWRNEKVEYGPIEDDELVEEIGDMPVPKAVIRALDTPYRKRKEPAKSKSSSKSKSKRKQGSSRHQDRDDEDNEAFDSSKLKRKYKNNLLEGETANVWDDGNDDLNDLSKFLVPSTRSKMKFNFILRTLNVLLIGQRLWHMQIKWRQQSFP